MLAQAEAHGLPLAEVESLDRAFLAISAKKLRKVSSRTGLCSALSSAGVVAVESVADGLIQRGYFVVQGSELRSRVSVMREGCLNVFAKPVDTGPPPTLVGVVEALRLRLTALHAAFILAENGTIDYDAMCTSAEYLRFRLAALELQRLDLSQLPTGDPEVVLAFYINLYNCLIMHGTAEMGPPSNSMARTKFFAKVSYMIGPHLFTCNDLEHGILRCNRPMPGTRTPQFEDSDPRLQFVLTSFDNRIHFALNCGARSCPPVRVYTPGNVAKGLQFAAEQFVRESTHWNPSSGSLNVSKIFEWYLEDFAPTAAELPAALCRFLDPFDSTRRAIEDHVPMKVVFSKYDWTSNAKGAKKLSFVNL